MTFLHMSMTKTKPVFKFVLYYWNFFGEAKSNPHAYAIRRNFTLSSCTVPVAQWDIAINACAVM